MKDQSTRHCSAFPAAQATVKSPSTTTPSTKFSATSRGATLATEQINPLIHMSNLRNLDSKLKRSYLVKNLRPYLRKIIQWARTFRSKNKTTIRIMVLRDLSLWAQSSPSPSIELSQQLVTCSAWTRSVPCASRPTVLQPNSLAMIWGKVKSTMASKATRILPHWVSQCPQFKEMYLMWTI